MISIEHIECWGIKHAIRGMRNPMNSWDKSDSVFNYFINWETDELVGESLTDEDICIDLKGVPDWNKNMTMFGSPTQNAIGPNDKELMLRLVKAGPEHRKFLRQIFVSMDITAPLYWWKEFDTYKVGTTANSCSTMHKIHAKEFELKDFSHEHLYSDEKEVLKSVISALNGARELYLDSRHKNDWWQMIQLLPSSYNQKRTVTMTYENVLNMCLQRENHKLDEWHGFVKLCVAIIPCFADIFNTAKENVTP